MELKYLYLYTFILLVPMVKTLVQEKPYPPRLQSCLQKMSENASLPQTAGESISHYCISHFLATTNERFRYNVSSVGLEWVHSLLHKYVNKPRVRRQAFNRRRKEYRMLTDAERTAYHTAIKRLKADTSVPPNRYDFLAEIHTGPAIPSAHNGPNFYGWHRIYLVIYEDALREMVPGVTVPYWDSSLDFDIPDPTQSIIWTDSFLGNGDGAVTTGPFANWRTASGPLTRNIGSSSRLYSKESLQNILTRTRMSEISYPSASAMYNLEYHHNGPHNWVDGQMAGLETAPQDPVFYMHHAYVDYLWELFRIRQRQFGVDPSLDYPSNYGEAVHAPGNAMDGMAQYTNVQGYDDFWMSTVYTYDRAPSCSWMQPDCGSRYLRCDTGRSRCVSTESNVNVGRQLPNKTFGLATGSSTIVEVPMSEDIVRIRIGARFVGPPSDGRSRMRRNVKTADIHQSVKQPADDTNITDKANLTVSKNNDTDKDSISSSGAINHDTCLKSDIGGAFQNTFDINGISDMNLWVFLPVTIIHQRPIGAKFQSYAVHNGEIDDGNDIYSPPAHTSLYAHLHSDSSDPLPSCATSPSGAGKVFVQSDGISYMGRYKDYAVIDHRQPITTTTSYVAVMDPQLGSTSVILTAYDSCGRICHPRCRVQEPWSSDYLPCSGVIDVTSVSPRQYAFSYSDAVSSVWNFQNRDFPQSSNENLSVAFYCTNEDRWPWSD